MYSTADDFLQSVKSAWAQRDMNVLHHACLIDILPPSLRTQIKTG